jgi:hypothetical protein
MTIEQLGSIGELVAAVATVATLVYLSLQIRASTKISRVESRRTTTAQAKEFSALIANSTELTSIFRRGLADIGSLDPDERIRFNFLFSMLVSQTQSTFEDSESGILDRDVFETVSVSVFHMLSTPGGSQFWKEFRGGYVPEFRERIDDVLAVRKHNK